MIGLLTAAWFVGSLFAGQGSLFAVRGSRPPLLGPRPSSLAPVIQAPRPSPLAPVAGTELTVSLLTFETGGLIWERFGHNGILIHDASTGIDHLYDYGRFSFQQAHFFLRFAQGKMWYSMGDTTDPMAVVEFYGNEGRKAWIQELDLTAEQKVKLRDFLLWNIRPENAQYAYDYYRDNCSTRIRDALDVVLGGAIRRYGEQPSGFTWREETRRLDEHSKVIYTGLMIGLGQPVDRPMTRWEQMFLPIRLRQHMDSVKVAGPDGVEHPIVKSERVLAPGGRWPVPDRPQNWTLSYLLVGVVAGGLLIWLGKKLPAGFLLLGTLWALIAGVLGLLLTWLWVFSTHKAAYRNENLFLFNLLALALAVVLPSAVRGKAWALKPARRLALWIAALAALGLLLKIIPLFGQKNLELIAFALPIHAGLWLGLRSRAPS